MNISEEEPIVEASNTTLQQNRDHQTKDIGKYTYSFKKKKKK